MGKQFTNRNATKIKNIYKGIRGSKPPSIVSADFNDTTFRAWLKKETNSIDIRGIYGGSGNRIGASRFPILKLYTDLFVRAGLSNLDLETGRAGGGQRRLLLDVANSTRCLIIVGDPGSGKTTFLRFIAAKQLTTEKNLLPCYVRLSDVYEFAILKNIRFTHDLFIASLLNTGEQEKLYLTKYGLEKRATNGEILWLLDGLDELPSSIARENIVKAVEDASQTWKKCRFVLTSRPLALKGKAIPSEFEKVGIDQMQDGEIYSFLDAWTTLLFQDGTETVRQNYLSELHTSIRDHPTIRSLAKNPVMLTCLAVLHYNEHHMPEAKADLLEAVIQWLIRARERPEKTCGELSPNIIEDIYHKIALEMFKMKSGPIYQIGRLQAATIIKNHFNNDEKKALNFLEQAEAEIGILVSRGVGDLGFWHSFFQEYITAKEIAGKTDSVWWHEIRDNLDKYEWRGVICLIPACLMRLGTDRVDLFFRRMSQNVASFPLPEKAKRAGLGGCILNDLGVYDYSPKEVRAWNKILTDVVPIFSNESVKIPLIDRFDAAVAYGIGGDPRLHNFEDTWVKIQGGVFFMGAQMNEPANDNYDEEATAWEGPVTQVSIEPFEIRKYPITVEEYMRFVENFGYEDCSKNFWSKDGWAWKQTNRIEAPKNMDSQKLTPNCPITYVSWFEAEAYANWLTANDRRFVYRLPSEAEWEFVARSGNVKSKFTWGNVATTGDLAEANWAGSGIGKVTPVGIFPQSNTVDSVTDMIGNVEEWCVDNWSERHSSCMVNSAPRIIDGEQRRVVRGGSTIRVSRLCRITYRSRCKQGNQYGTIGFRLTRHSKKQ